MNTNFFPDKIEEKDKLTWRFLVFIAISIIFTIPFLDNTITGNRSVTYIIIIIYWLGILLFCVNRFSKKRVCYIGNEGVEMEYYSWGKLVNKIYVPFKAIEKEPQISVADNFVINGIRTVTFIVFITPKLVFHYDNPKRFDGICARQIIKAWRKYNGKEDIIINEKMVLYVRRIIERAGV